jgi:predicted DNA-binding transcriptional regulator YafY
MSYAKAADLLRVADMATNPGGVSLRDVEREFHCTFRTAQRIMRAFEDVFLAAEQFDDAERRRHWRLRKPDAAWLHAQGLRDSEIAALDMAVRRAERDGAPDEAKQLQRVRDRLLAAMTPVFRNRAEADAEALLEAQGFASRPGPRMVRDETLLGTITEALRAPFELKIHYQGNKDVEPRPRRIEPHGLLLGTRRYLVARPSGGDEQMRHYRLDRIAAAEITGKSFAREQDFDLSSYAAQGFGSYHADHEFGPVVWRFAPEAAETAHGFMFHPGQTVTEEPDGSLTVRFEASGHLEMAWHLYCWGNAVEVLKPAALRDLVAQYRRGDFPALP